MKPQAIKQHYITEFVNSGMSQQEAEEKWNEISQFVDENGWAKSKELNPIDLNIPFKNRLYNDFDFESLWRPKSLDGIENNRGWTSILSEKDLPSEDSKERYEVCFDGKLKPFLLVDAEAINKYWKTSPLSHYKKYEPSADPIF